MNRSLWPWLPVELYTHILSFLPVDPSGSDTSVYTLVACLSASVSLASAARVSALWEPRYRARYTTCVEEWEERRWAEAGGTWYKMYTARRRRDKEALDLVDDIRVNSQRRHEKVVRFTQELSFDVWDALQLETQLPVPACFRISADSPTASGGSVTAEAEASGSSSQQDALLNTSSVSVGMLSGDDVEVPPNALPRRYWSKAIMGVIARSYALRFWTGLYSVGEPSITFEQVLAGFSAFFEESPKKIFAQLDELAANCRQRLIRENYELDSSGEKYDIKALCIRLRALLREDGFEVVRVTDGGTFYQPLNQFPHWFLHPEHRQTIPMSMTYVFVAVAGRIGIQAAPTNFPGKIQVYITSPKFPEQGDMLLDFVNDPPPLVFKSRDPTQMLADAGLASDARPDFVTPCSMTKILMRSATNIITAVRFQRMGFLDIYTETYENASYAACVALLLDTHDPQTIGLIVDVMPLDTVAILRNIVAPVLNDMTRAILVQRCRTREEEDEVRAVKTNLRSKHNIKYFVGTVFQHVQFKYTACVIGWQPKCMASPEWIEAMQVKKLARGPDQPFYSVIGTDGGKRYVPEDAIEPISLTRDILHSLITKRATFSRYFTNVENSRPDGTGGRLVISEELQRRYPEDDEAAKEWIMNTGD